MIFLERVDGLLQRVGIRHAERDRDRRGRRHGDAELLDLRVPGRIPAVRQEKDRRRGADHRAGLSEWRKLRSRPDDKDLAHASNSSALASTIARAAAIASARDARFLATMDSRSSKRYRKTPSSLCTDSSTSRGIAMS